MVREQADILHLPATSSLASVRAALACHESCEVLLVFRPVGAVELASPEALATLYAFCREQEIEAVFVGGDETLRAAAVAAGFAAASSIDVWKAQEPVTAAAFVQPSAEEWAAADAALVAGSLGRADDSVIWHADPPEYVLRLLGGEGSFAGPRDEPTPEEAARLIAEAADTDPLLRAHQAYEERITAMIRDTGRLPAWRPSEWAPASQ